MSGRKCVAIVDDDPLVRKSGASLLRSYGISTQTFESADAFLVSDFEAFDCLISDVQLGDTSGLALLEKLRERSAHLPVILVTAYPNEAIQSRANAAGIEVLLEKPWDIDDLIASLERILGPLD